MGLKFLDKYAVDGRHYDANLEVHKKLDSGDRYAKIPNHLLNASHITKMIDMKHIQIIYNQELTNKNATKEHAHQAIASDDERMSGIGMRSSLLNDDDIRPYLKSKALHVSSNAAKRLASNVTNSESTILEPEMAIRLERQNPDGWKNTSSFRKNGYNLSTVRDIFQRPLGYIHYNPSTGHISKMHVDKERRGRGIGSLLLQDAYSEDRDTHLHVRTSNKEAIGLYHKNGFEIADTIKDYYNNGDDAHLMIRKVK